MEEWSSKKNDLIDEKLKDARQSDLRFFRIDEFKRNIERVGTFSGKCPVCNKEQININSICEKIDLAVGSPGRERREYDRLISRLASHMHKEHGYHTPNHYTYRYSFYGMLIGALAGMLGVLVAAGENWAYFSAGFSVGLLIGYLYGSKKDRKIRQMKMLM